MHVFALSNSLYHSTALSLRMEAKVYFTCFLGKTSAVDLYNNLTMHKHRTCGPFSQGTKHISHGGHSYIGKEPSF
jgi:hypothetical protein